MADQRPCTALMKYEPRRFQWLRVQQWFVNGHCFLREAGWLCACGLRRPIRILSDIPRCATLPD
jgi:hypothetical protein